MHEADDAVQMHGSRPQLQPHGSEGTEGLQAHHQDLDQDVGHDRSPGGADDEEHQQDLDEEQRSLQQISAQMQN